MTISSTTVQNTYTPATPTTVFAIAPIDYLDDSTIVVKKNGVTLAVGTNYTIDTVNVTLLVAATSGDTVTLTRVTPLTQTKDLVNGDPVPVETLEEAVDRIVRQVQEIDHAVDSVTSSSDLPTPESLEYLRWNAGATALENYDLGAEMTALTATVGGFNTNISSLTTRIGSVESDINDIQAKDAAQDITIGVHTASIGVLQAEMLDTRTRLLAAENSIISLNAFRNNALSFLGEKGEEDLPNNVATELTSLAFMNTLYSSIHIDYEISRNTDSNYKTSVGKLYLVSRGNGVWTTERGLQIVDADGVVFSIATEVGGMSTVTATTDNLAGTSYVGKFKYRIIKFEV